MRTYTDTAICRLPKELRDRAKQMCRETNKTESSILREGLTIVLKDWEGRKQQQQFISQF
jgi:predicted DNA-binding protein